MKGFFVVVFLLVIIRPSVAQDTLKLSNNFKFKEGVYNSFEALKRNQPTYAWDEIKEMTYVDRDDYVAKFEYLLYFDVQQDSVVDLLKTDIWGVCIDGIPFIKTMDEGSQTPHFVGFRTRGKICYYTYPTTRRVKVPMRIYDPVSGVLVYTKYVINNEPDTVQKVFSFDNGRVDDFRLDVLQNWLSDDVQLTNTLNDLNQQVAEEKLHRLMLIYNDRNLIYLKKD